MFLTRFITFLATMAAIVAKSLVGKWNTSSEGHCNMTWVTLLNVICEYGHDKNLDKIEQKPILYHFSAADSDAPQNRTT